MPGLASQWGKELVTLGRAARGAGTLLTGPTARSIGLYGVLPASIAYGMYSAGGPPVDGGDKEPMYEKARRMQKAWLAGGALSGGLAGHGLSRALGGSALTRLGGGLAGMAIGGGLAHEYGAPVTAQHVYRGRMARRRFPGGTDPAYGLPVEMADMEPWTPERWHQKARWGV